MKELVLEPCHMVGELLELPGSRVPIEHHGLLPLPLDSIVRNMVWMP